MSRAGLAPAARVGSGGVKTQSARIEGLGTTIFAEMSALALQTGSVNLGQGFPDTDGPGSVIEAVVYAMNHGRNQYAPGVGVPELREAIAAHQKRWYGLDVDPATEVAVSTGATEAIAAALLGLVDPGDEVVALEPYYDSYVAVIQMAGGVRRPVTLRAPDFRLPDRRAEGRRHTAHHRDPAELPAQPDRRRADAATSSRRLPPSPASTTSSSSPTRSTST